jgi:hypothetical protein
MPPWFRFAKSSSTIAAIGHGAMLSQLASCIQTCHLSGPQILGACKERDPHAMCFPARPAPAIKV